MKLVVFSAPSGSGKSTIINYLLEKGIDKILKKVGEESAEVIIASKNNAPDEVIYETADLMYHLSVMLFDRGVTWQEIFEELKKREK